MAVVKRRTAILISGRGSNMEALIAAARYETFPAEICLVVSNRPDAPGITAARMAGIRAEVVDHRQFGRDRAAHERAIHDLLRGAGIEIVCLAGYLRVLTSFLVDRWEGRMLNVHPSLPNMAQGLGQP